MLMIECSILDANFPPKAKTKSKKKKLLILIISLIVTSLTSQKGNGIF